MMTGGGGVGGGGGGGVAQAASASSETRQPDRAIQRCIFILPAAPDIIEPRFIPASFPAIGVGRRIGD